MNKTNCADRLSYLRHAIVFLLLLMYINCADAQKIHALVFADIEDINIGNGCKNDVKHIQSFLTELSSALGNDNVDEHDYIFRDFNSRKFNNCIADIKSTSNDIIILYVSSHGDRIQSAKNEFPDIKFGQGPASAYNLFLKMIKIPHRTCIGIIDACNEFRESTPGELINFSKGGTINNPIDTPAYKIIPANVKRLFIDRKFDMLITGSQTGVDCITNTDGSIFTSSLRRGFEYVLSLSKTNLVTMDVALDRIKYLTQYESSRQIYNHPEAVTISKTVPYYPMWRICSENNFPCDPGIALDSIPEFINIDLASAVTKLRFQIADYYKSTNAYSIIAQTKDVDLQKAKLELAEQANNNFDVTKRFTLSNDDKKPIKPEIIRDVSPDQFVIKSNPIMLSDSMKKTLKTQSKFLVSLNLIAPAELSKKIDHVDYYLDPDLPKSILTSTERKDGYKRDIFLNDDFYLIVKVFFQDNTNIELGNELVMPKN